MDNYINFMFAFAYTVVAIYFLLEIFVIGQHLACN